MTLAAFVWELSKATYDRESKIVREKRPSPAIEPDDMATSTFNNFLRSAARKAGLGRVILYSVASGGRNRSPPSLGAQCGRSVRKRAEKSKNAISNRRCGRARACAQERYIYIFELISARATSLPSLIAIRRLLGKFRFLWLPSGQTSAPTHCRPFFESR